MNHQLDLFHSGPLPPHNGSPTSIQAARKQLRKGTEIDRERIYQALRKSTGTREEIAARTGIPVNTVNARVRELILAGRAVVLTRAGLSSTGSPAGIVVAL